MGACWVCRDMRGRTGQSGTRIAWPGMAALTSKGWEMNILVALGGLKFFSKAARCNDF